MNLVELVKSECVVAGLELSSKDDCLRKIAQLAKQAPQLRDIDEADILSGLQRREQMGSTGFGKGIAIPHCRLPGVKEFVVGVISVPEGVEFDTLDNEKAHLIVFIVAPESEANEHVSILSAISRILRLEDACREMLSATTSDLLLESFVRYQRDDATAVGNRHLFHISILNDDIFREILQLLTAMEPASLAIIEAKQASEFLAKMPLFAGFWHDREMSTGRMIIAQIDKRLTNETIRSIEDVVGKLDDSTEVSVCIQDIFFSAGRLNA